MSPLLWPALALLLLLPAGDQVLITKKGEKIEGPVTRDGADYVVETLSGPRRIHEADVALVFETIREVTQRAEERFREAKRLYEEASHLEEAHPSRNEKLSLAIEIAQGAVSTYRILQPHYGGTSGGSIPQSIQILMQFIRLCRSAATVGAVVGSGASRSTSVALEAPAFAFTPPAAPDRPWVLGGPLGPGLLAAAQDLGHSDPERRLAAVRRLTHPPSPLHLAALLRLLEAEREPTVLRALSEGLALLDSAPIVKSLSWAKRETDPARRGAAFALLRAVGDRAAFDFLLGWFEESPPATHPDRAVFASAFRQQRGLAIPQLKELLARNRNPKVQTEAIRQLGVIGDKAAAPMLLRTLGSFPKDSAVSLLKLGKPAVPTLIEGARAHEAETHRICASLLRRHTGLAQPSLIPVENWWATNRKAVQDDEKSWWEEQSQKGWTVDPESFSTYDLPMESIIP
jgi:hypothetical protein